MRTVLDGVDEDATVKKRKHDAGDLIVLFLSYRPCAATGGRCDKGTGGG